MLTRPAHPETHVFIGIQRLTRPARRVFVRGSRGPSATIPRLFDGQIRLRTLMAPKPAPPDFSVLPLSQINTESTESVRTGPTAPQRWTGPNRP